MVMVFYIYSANIVFRGVGCTFKISAFWIQTRQEELHNFEQKTLFAKHKKCNSKNCLKHRKNLRLRLRLRLCHTFDQLGQSRPTDGKA